MAQASIVISNASGASVRSAVNSALEAITTKQSGGTAPATTYPFMEWADTTNDLLKQRNAANSAWITKGTLSDSIVGLASQAEAEAGSATDKLMTPLRVSQAIAALAIPAGAVMAFGANTAPSGWLECDGSLVSRTTYADLFAAIGTTFGVGDGSTTFALPDLRGEFIRGWDDGRGVDSGRALGTWQADDFKSHQHQSWEQRVSPDGNVDGAATTNSTSAMTAGVSTNTNYMTWFAGGTETRPRNVALLYCIKY